MSSSVLQKAVGGPGAGDRAAPLGGLALPPRSPLGPGPPWRVPTDRQPKGYSRGTLLCPEFFVGFFGTKSSFYLDLFFFFLYKV